MNVFDFAPVACLRVGVDGKIIQTNQVAADLMGVERSCLLDRMFVSCVSDLSRDKAETFIRQLHESMVRQACEIELVGPYKTAIIVQLAGVVDSDGKSVVISLTDITECRLAEERARRSEAFLDSILENIPHLVFVKDANHLGYVKLNRAFEQFWGVERGEVLGRLDRTLFGDVQAASFNEQDREILRAGIMLDIPEETLTTPLGDQRVLHTKKISLPDAHGAPRYLLGISEDITDIKRTRDEREYFFNQALDMLCIASFEGAFIEVNPAFSAKLGYTKHELLTHSFFTWVHPDDIESTQRALEGCTSGLNVRSFENRYRCKDGSYRHLLWSSQVDTQSKRIYAVAYDFTERRELEAAVLRVSAREKERIARDLHDGLGQVLIGIAFKSKLIENMLNKGVVPAASMVGDLVRYANEASVQARSLAYGLDPIALRDGICAALDNLARSTRALFGVECAVTARLLREIEDNNTMSQLYRIAQESITNAVKHGQAEKITLSLNETENELVLTVTDNGRGFPEEMQDGQGFGLKIMEYRAKAIGGALMVRPEKNGGVSVTCIVAKNTQPAATT
jgi:PAS domain S-box-containing protein